jgi:hypothetical protein
MYYVQLTHSSSLPSINLNRLLLHRLLPIIMPLPPRNPTASMPLNIMLIQQLPKQTIHLLQRLAHGLRIPNNHDDHARDVDGEEDEVGLGADVLDADGEELADYDGADGAGGRGDVDAFCADVGWEDLWGLLAALKWCGK